MKNLVISACLMTGLACGCSEHTETAADAATAAGVASVNSHCPIMGGDVTADGGRAEWNGQTIGFCCPECIDKWSALSDDEKAAALAEADGHASGDHSHEHDHNDAGSGHPS